MCGDERDDEGSIVKYRDDNIEVRVKKVKLGCWKAWIKDLKTGIKRSGPYVPGDPKDFDFDPKRECWVFKK